MYFEGCFPTCVQVCERRSSEVKMERSGIVEKQLKGYASKQASIECWNGPDVVVYM